jgi:hypothetical protein
MSLRSAVKNLPIAVDVMALKAGSTVTTATLAEAQASAQYARERLAFYAEDNDSDMAAFMLECWKGAQRRIRDLEMGCA